MEFNSKNAYGQSLVYDTTIDISEELFWSVLENVSYAMKEIIPKELLHRVKWEVLNYPNSGRDELSKYQYKYFKVITWRYTPEHKSNQEISDERM